MLVLYKRSVCKIPHGKKYERTMQADASASRQLGVVFYGDCTIMHGLA